MKKSNYIVLSLKSSLVESEGAEILKRFQAVLKF
jgi:hypothetical protein